MDFSDFILWVFRHLDFVIIFLALCCGLLKAILENKSKKPAAQGAPTPKEKTAQAPKAKPAWLQDLEQEFETLHQKAQEAKAAPPAPVKKKKTIASVVQAQPAARPSVPPPPQFQSELEKPKDIVSVDDAPSAAEVSARQMADSLSSFAEQKKIKAAVFRPMGESEQILEHQAAGALEEWDPLELAIVLGGSLGTPVAFRRGDEGLTLGLRG